MTLDLFLPTSGDRPFYGAMVERRDGPSWLRDGDDDDVTAKTVVKILSTPHWGSGPFRSPLATPTAGERWNWTCEQCHLDYCKAVEVPDWRAGPGRWDA